MRSTLPVRKTRGGRLVTRALKVGVPVSAAALSAGSALAATAATQTGVPARVGDHHVSFGHPVVVTGRVPAREAGHRLALEFLPAGGSSWQTMTAAIAHSDGAYRLSAPVRRSGMVRVVDSTSPSTPSTPVASAASASASTAAQHITVAAKLHVHPEALSSLNGQRLAVKGQMYPRLPGRIVRLQGRRGEGWQTLATTSTGRGGRFTLRFTPTGGSRALRVEFAGDRQNAKAATPAGSAASYQQAVASWYDDGGSTACGFHAYLGVANKSLPCGAHVTFSYGGRTVTATVDDRGPYVGGREFDLNQNTAAALGFGGVGTVAYSS